MCTASCSQRPVRNHGCVGAGREFWTRAAPGYLHMIEPSSSFGACRRCNGAPLRYRNRPTSGRRRHNIRPEGGAKIPVHGGLKPSIFPTSTAAPSPAMTPARPKSSSSASPPHRPENRRRPIFPGSACHDRVKAPRPRISVQAALKNASCGHFSSPN